MKVTAVSAPSTQSKDPVQWNDPLFFAKGEL